MNITEYLARHEAKDLLRFLTCGSVDDGKSTLIGRLLHDTKSIYEDQLAAIRKDSLTHGTTGTDFDPALLTDGLKAEREQGITIDVAYRYFSTEKRMFIIADTPGHEQYTRNMATGASTCSLAVVLVDARHGVITQTRRHSFIASLLGIRHVVIAINKMDLVDWSEQVFESIRAAYDTFVARLDFQDIHYIPLSALQGDNVVDKSIHMPWYKGPSLLHHLENVNISTDRNLIDLRFPVQYVIRPDLSFRGYAGTVASGVLRVGDEVVCMPSRSITKVASIETFNGPLEEACPPLAVTVTLKDDVDLSRGGMLVHPNNMPRTGHEWEAMVVWMDAKAATTGQTYLIKQATDLIPGAITDIRYRIDVNTMRKDKTTSLAMNDIARVRVTLHRSAVYDPYQRNRQTGGFILIDRLTNATVAAGMILDRTAVADAAGKSPASAFITEEISLVDEDERRRLLGQSGVTLWLTGLSGSGKSTLAKRLEADLVKAKRHAILLDGDNIRHGLSRDLGFTPEDRTENIRRVAEVARLFNRAGFIVITAFISPYRADRDMARSIIGDDRFLEVYISTPIEVCEARDPKKLYEKARSGEISQFTGISDPYEAPVTPALELETSTLEVDECMSRFMALLAKHSFDDGKQEENV